MCPWRGTRYPVVRSSVKPDSTRIYISSLTGPLQRTADLVHRPIPLYPFKEDANLKLNSSSEVYWPIEVTHLHMPYTLPPSVHQNTVGRGSGVSSLSLTAMTPAPLWHKVIFFPLPHGNHTCVSCEFLPTTGGREKMSPLPRRCQVMDFPCARTCRYKPGEATEGHLHGEGISVCKHTDSHGGNGGGVGGHNTGFHVKLACLL